jgi:hypothetical protein
MTPEQFEKRLRRLERKVCCLAECPDATLMDIAPESNPDNTQLNTIQFNSETGQSWYVDNDGIQTEITPECPPEAPCTTTLFYSVTTSGGGVGFSLSANSEWGPGYSQNQGNNNVSSGTIVFNDGDLVRIQAIGSSILDFSILVEASVDGELYNVSETGANDGDEFEFEIDCTQTYTVTVVLNQHS